MFEMISENLPSKQKKLSVNLEYRSGKFYIGTTIPDSFPESVKAIKKVSMHTWEDETYDVDTDGYYLSRNEIIELEKLGWIVKINGFDSLQKYEEHVKKSEEISKKEYDAKMESEKIRISKCLELIECLKGNEEHIHHIGKNHTKDLYEHSIMVGKSLQKHSVELAEVGYLHDIGKLITSDKTGKFPKHASKSVEVLSSLKILNQFQLELIENHHFIFNVANDPNMTDKAIIRWIEKILKSFSMDGIKLYGFCNCLETISKADIEDQPNYEKAYQVVSSAYKRIMDVLVKYTDSKNISISPYD